MGRRGDGAKNSLRRPIAPSPRRPVTIWLTGSGWLGRVLAVYDRRRVVLRPLWRISHVNVSFSYNL
jgi:hypothetical protein